MYQVCTCPQSNLIAIDESCPIHGQPPASVTYSYCESCASLRAENAALKEEVERFRILLGEFQAGDVTEDLSLSLNKIESLKAEVERLKEELRIETELYVARCQEVERLKENDKWLRKELHDATVSPEIKQSRLALLERVVEAVKDDGGRYGAGTPWCLVDTLRQAVSPTGDVFNKRLLCAADRLKTALAALSPKEGRE